ncbi:MAG: 50S ribosomal protein L10 [Candidatus Aenigmatarchaeota archaeon]
MKGRAEVKPEKLKAVEEFAKLIKQSPVLGIIDLYKTPASALQKIKKELRGKATIRVAKKSTLLFALDKAGKGNLKEYMVGYPALIFADINPFKLYLFLQKKKTPAFAKPGDVTIKDIEVKAGPTDLPPGPAISSLTKVGIPAKVVAGKIAVAKDKIVLKAGEKVTLELASALQMLKMQPMEIGLNVVVIDENGTVYKKDQLFVDEEKIRNDVQIAINNAFNLSINAEILMKETIGFMLAKAQMEAKTLATEAKIEG